MSDANTRPAFYVPFPAGSSVSAKSYPGHNPDHMKMDMYAANWPSVVASAPGIVHEHFEPGGMEIRHYIPGTRVLGNWYTTYMHMSSRASVGTRVDYGQGIGSAGTVGTWVKHLHHEQLHDRTPDGDADTRDIVYPAFVEYNNGKPFFMPLGEPGVRMVSKNKKGLTGVPKPTPKPVPKPVPKPSGTVTVTVKKYDTLSSIAKKYNTTWQAIAKLNKLSNPNALRIGQRLYVVPLTVAPKPKPKPKPVTIVTVKKWETLDGIARAHKTTWQKLQKLNNIKNPNQIYVGQKIRIG